MKVEDVARICHDANKAYCETQGDASQRNWYEAAECQRDSAIKGVRFRLNFPNAPVSVQHNEWRQEKANDGWKYGLVKDADKKEHPCMVSYEELPEYRRLKDFLFVSIVETFRKEVEL